MKKFYSRIFTDVFPKTLKNRLEQVQKTIVKVVDIGTIKRKIVHFLVLDLVLFAMFLAYSVFEMMQTYKQATEERTREVQRLAHWEQVVRKHSNFADAYYEAAISAARLKEFEKAIVFLKKALILDPTFAEAEKLRDEILSR